MMHVCVVGGTAVKLIVPDTFFLALMQMLFNQNNEMMLTITKCSPETLDQFKTLNGLGTRGGHPEVTLSLLRSPNKSKTPDHWDGIQEGGASSCHGDSDQQVGLCG